MPQVSRSQPRKTYYLPRDRLEDLLNRVGVVVVSDTSTDLLGYCPFHSNRDTPAFNISLTGPHLWKCHNGKCGKQGNVLSLLILKGYSKSEAQKMLLKGSMEIDDLVSLVQSLMAEEKEVENEWHRVDLNKFKRDDQDSNYRGRDYLFGRGISQEAYKQFELGYSAAKDMVVLPVFSEDGWCIGVIGREIRSKRYQYSNGLRRRSTIWNLHNSREYERIILTEGALDAVYIWQAGCENVSAIFGSSISDDQWRLLRKYFTEVICFFDNDEAGRNLTESVLASVSDLEVSFVTYPDRMIEYVEHDGTKERAVKDPGELTIDEINKMIDNRTSSVEYFLKELA